MDESHRPVVEMTLEDSQDSGLLAAYTDACLSSSESIPLALKSIATNDLDDMGLRDCAE